MPHGATLLRAHIAAGRPQAMQPLGGFEEWSLLVRDALLWLGEADPVTTIERSRAEDPGRQSLEAILVQWNEIIGARRVSAKQVIEAALAVVQTQSDEAHNRLVNPEFRATLLAVAGDNDRIVSRRLGHWLSANKGKVVNDRRIVADGIRDGIARWRMQRWTNGKWE